MSRPDLYPPRIDHTYQDTFINTSTMRVYFALSDFGDLSKIDPECVQVLVKRQDTGDYVLNSVTGIKLKKMFIDEERGATNQDKYYVEIYPKDLTRRIAEEGEFVPYTLSLGTPSLTQKIPGTDKGKTKIIIASAEEEARLRAAAAEDPPLATTFAEFDEYKATHPLQVAQREFSTDYYYQVQLRFTAKDRPLQEVDKSTIYATDNWFVANVDAFSEWSKITLVKAIKQPILYLQVGTEEPKNATENILLPNFVTLNFDFTNKDGYNSVADPLLKQYIARYKVQIHKKDSLTTQIYDSGMTAATVFKDTLSIEIPYFIEKFIDRKKIVIDGEEIETDEIEDIVDAKGKVIKRNEYDITIYYELNTGYSQTLTFHANAVNNPEVFPGSILIKPEPENGQVRLDIYSKKSKGKYVKFNRWLKILRASSEDSFEKWVCVATIAMNGGYAIYWYDRTCESDVWYRYGAQLCYNPEIDFVQSDEDFNSDIISKAHFVSQPIRLDMDDSFLVSNYTQLKVKYNPNINSFKYNVKDTITETLGGQFPFVTRNGSVKYRTFPISGTIAQSMDDECVFRNDRALFKSEIEKAFNNHYNDAMNISKEGDVLAERRFREQVMDFLYSGRAFLWKSPTEGNIIVRLTDVSFSPIQGLGRRLYNFSATATEIADCSMDNYNNYDKYEIQKNGLDLTYDWVIITPSYTSPILGDEERGLVNHIGYEHPSTAWMDPNEIYLSPTLNQPYADLVLSKDYIKKNTTQFGLNQNYKIQDGILVLTNVITHDPGLGTDLAIGYAGAARLN